MLEICCGSFYDAYQAFLAKAKRIELNSALYLGGLTPATATLKLIKEKTNLEVIAMVRPRAGGFCYTKLEIEEIFSCAKDLLENGADGLAFGFLNPDFTINLNLTEKMVKLIHSYNKTAVFHRAIDVTQDYFESIEQLISLKVDRILTSGQENTAIEGIQKLQEANFRYGSKITFLAGSGVNQNNIKLLKDSTKIQEFHSSCKDYLEDLTTSNQNVSYSYLGNNKYDIVSKEKVEILLETLKNA